MKRCHMCFWTALTVLLGFVLGIYYVQIEKVGAPSPIIVLPQDIHEPVPLIHIMEINNGSIVGKVGTGARLIIGDEVIIAASDGSFSTPAEPFLVNVIDVAVPHGALFVASSRGKKYYSVTSRAGERLSPKNRIYFRSAEEAEMMGYERGR